MIECFQTKKRGRVREKVSASDKNGRKKRDIDGIETLSREIIDEIEIPDIEELGIPGELKESVKNAGPESLREMEKKLGLGDIEEETDTVSFTEKESDVLPDGEVYDPDSYNADGRFEIHVADDRMNVTIDLFPSAGGGRPLSLGAIRTALNDMKVVYGVNTDLLERIVKKVEESKSEKAGVAIARGTPPAQGKDGTIEFLFGESDEIFEDE